MARGVDQMGRIAVVTTFSAKGYETYGRFMLKMFDMRWPHDVPLYVFYENAIPPDAPNKRTVWFNLDWNLEREAFMRTHKDPPNVNGHSYQQMPVKFCHKVFALTSAPRDCDWLIWLDGDIETRKPVTHEFLNSILRDDVVGVYLGRRWWTHTEGGFYAIRMSLAGKAFLDDFRKVYTSDKIMELTQKHDCSAFDYVRQVYEGRQHRFHDLGERHCGPDIDVMARSVLGEYLFHNKGEYRKMQAYGAVA